MPTVREWYSAGHSGERPKVSVCTVTYNHEDFIADTIEGVLMQEVDFPVELVIGEDGSPDGTRAVIERYSAEYPGFIQLNPAVGNVGANQNFRNTYLRCKGDYIAILDGDDFWTSPRKLRTQVDLLDANPNYAMCFHLADLRKDGEILEERVLPKGERPFYTLADIPDGIYMAASTFMCRGGLITQFPDWYSRIFFGDYAMKVLMAEHGDIAYVPEVLSARRFHSGSIWLGTRPSAADSIDRHMSTVEAVTEHLPGPSGDPFRRKLHAMRYGLVHAHLDEGDRAKAKAALIQAQRRVGNHPLKPRSEPMRAKLHYYAKPLYELMRAARHGGSRPSDVFARIGKGEHG